MICGATVFFFVWLHLHSKSFIIVWKLFIYLLARDVAKQILELFPHDVAKQILELFPRDVAKQILELHYQ